ncbi:pyridoxal phosphate-dependent aminotransferase [Pajaroellobacter abortibovis]|uniref:Aminotransferase n=1 Tax=Pajaroellobacter abortibovis TaxID=1882918 RepID=A0A1L6MVV9_9BACT|nr:pyridoxal phosphate-dependent aminotransferase [Pajaroellobacter abortibovis]APR99662.1 aspartate aminotransferase [Pajaroellobacter abortibovis]
MSHHFASRIQEVKPSATLAINARANELRRQGIRIFPFGVGEPDFDPPLRALEAAKKAIEEGASKYTAVSGIPSLKRAICEFTARRRGWTFTPASVCVSVGAKHALFNVALALYEPGDQVLVPAPYWVSYPEQVRLMGAEPIIIPTSESNGWRVTPKDLEKHLTPKTKAFLLCTPSNPTGSTYSPRELLDLIAVLRSHDCWIIADEIYGELVYDDFSYVSLAKLAPELRERIVVIDGVSKAYAMTGWRIGWAIVPPPLAKALDLIQGQSTTNATAVAQYAALAALSSADQSELKTFRERFERRRNVMVEGLNSLPGVHCRKPEGTFYAFADCRGLYGIEWEGKQLETDAQLGLWMLECAHVAAVPGDSFGAPGYFRFSYATNEEEIQEGMEALRNAILKGKRC